MPAGWSETEERKFRDDFARIVEQRRAMGQPLNRDPDDPRHHYKYREAWRAGKLGVDDQGHFASQFKEPDHPNRFVSGMDTINGDKPMNGVMNLLRSSTVAGGVNKADLFRQALANLGMSPGGANATPEQPKASPLSKLLGSESQLSGRVEDPTSDYNDAAQRGGELDEALKNYEAESKSPESMSDAELLDYARKISSGSGRLSERDFAIMAATMGRPEARHIRRQAGAPATREAAINRNRERLAKQRMNRAEQEPDARKAQKLRASAERLLAEAEEFKRANR